MKSTSTEQYVEKPTTAKVAEEDDSKFVKIQLDEQDCIVPVIIFAFDDAMPDGCRIPPGLHSEDMWREGVGCNVQPKSNTVRILIRPDVSKRDVRRILKRAIRIVAEDEYDWGEEVDTFLDNWRAKIENKKKGKSEEAA